MGVAYSRRPFSKGAGRGIQALLWKLEDGTVIWRSRVGTGECRMRF